jgi:hypothetical protein
VLIPNPPDGLIPTWHDIHPPLWRAGITMSRFFLPTLLFVEIVKRVNAILLLVEQLVVVVVVVVVALPHVRSDKTRIKLGSRPIIFIRLPKDPGSPFCC